MIHIKSHLTKYPALFLYAALILTATAIGSFYFGFYVQKVRYIQFMKSFQNVRENSDKYRFINPLIGGISAPATDVGIFTDLKDQIVSYLKDEQMKGNLYGYSFYFRDFDTGLWFGSNENIEFFPASLFKLPVALAVYKEAEDNPGLLSKIAIYTKELSDLNTSVSSNSQSILEVGKAYSIDELVTIMITKSDNGAKNLLLSILDKSYLDNLFNIVSLANPTREKTLEVSSRDYALFLRVLYGSSYLNEEHSEHLLSLLAQSTFKDGIVAGIPDDVSVAHKFGTYEFTENINGKTLLTQQLHDCGIVYSPKHPYIVCIMTKGKGAQNLYRIVSHVSGIIYVYQNSKDENK